MIDEENGPFSCCVSEPIIRPIFITRRVICSRFMATKNLAYRAYQRALDLNYPRPEAIRKAMDQVREMQVPRGAMNAGVIAAERADAAAWVADYQKFEDDLLRAGKNTDDEANYAPFYASHGRSLKTTIFSREITRTKEFFRHIQSRRFSRSWRQH